MEAPFRIRRDQNAVGSRQANVRDAGLACILIAVHVPIVEYLADDVGAVEYGVGNYAHRRGGYV
jgi:hypothetical protein